MAEVTFDKRRKLTHEEVFANINEYGQLSLGSSEKGIPINTQFVAEITGEVISVFNEKADKTFYSFPVKYHCKGFTPEYIEFQVTVVENKALKMVQENPDYVGKQVIFGKGRFNSKTFHSLLVLKQAPNEGFVAPKKMPDLSAPLTKEEQKAFATPESRQPELPVELTEWFENNIVPNKQAFLDNLATDKIGEHPVTFLAWISDPASCGTDYILNLTGPDKEAKALGLYHAMMFKLGVWK